MKKTQISSQFTQIPDRYVVIHDHKAYPNYSPESAAISYSTKLDNMKLNDKNAVSAYNMAIHTASRYHGEIFADFGDGTLNPVKSYRKEVKE